MKLNMNAIDRADAVDGPVVSEGGRSPSTLTTGRAAPPGADAPKPGPLAPGQRWSVARKREVVLRLLRGESAELLCRELGLPMFKPEQWRHKAEAALDGALKERCSATIKVRTPVNQDEKMFCRLRRREGGARPEAQATEIGPHFP